MESIHLVINKLFEKYKENDVIKDKIKDYICERLPLKLETLEKRYDY